MFGLGLGEILIIFFLIFIISPKDIPKFLRKLGQFFKTLDNIKDEIIDMKNDIHDTLKTEEAEKINKEIKKTNSIYNLTKKKKKK